MLYHKKKQSEQLYDFQQMVHTDDHEQNVNVFIAIEKLMDWQERRSRDKISRRFIKPCSIQRRASL